MEVPAAMAHHPFLQEVSNPRPEITPWAYGLPPTTTHLTFSPSQLSTSSSNYTMPALSLCIIARNEQEYIASCLESVIDTVDEIILVDTGSTDHTVEIARSLGAKIIHEPWHDHFARARNRSLEEASGDWILVLDADERLAPESRPHIRQAILETTAHAVNVLIKNFLVSDPLFGAWTSRAVRLFRNDPGIRFEGRVHERIMPSIERSGMRVADRNDILVIHYGYSDDGPKKRERQERNLRLLLMEIKERPGDPLLHYHLGATYQSMGEIQKAIEHLEQASKCAAPGEDSGTRAALSPGIVAAAAARLARLYLARNRLEEALQQCERAVQQGVTDPLVIFLAAVIHMHGYNFSTAAKVLQWGLSIAREKSAETLESGIRKEQLRLALAHCKRFDGRIEEALAEYTACTEQEPACLDAWIGRGQCEIQLQHYSRARNAFHRALELDPDSETAKIGIKVCQRALTDNATAGPG